MTTLERTISAANQARYGDGIEVSRYTADSYHDLRLDIAARALATYLKATDWPASVLEVAPGGSQFASKLLSCTDRGGLQLVAADLTRKACLGLQERGVPGLVCDITEGLPFRSQAFHAVFSGELVEHLFDPARFIRECWRVLRPNGLLVLTTPNLGNLQDRLLFPFGYPPRHVNPLHEYLRLHIRPFNKRLLKRLLTCTGFHKFTVNSNMIVFRTTSRRWESRRLASLFPSLGGSLIVTARKEMRL